MNLKRQGIPILGLNYKDVERTTEWLNMEIPMRIIFMITKDLALDLGVTGAPETFLIINGQVVAHYQSEVNEMVWNEVFVPAIEGEGLF